MVKVLAHATMTGSLVALLVAGPSSAQQQGGNTGVKAPKTDKGVTVSGCLTAGPAPNTFLLTARPDPLTSEMQGTGGGPITTVTYQLEGGNLDELRQWIGHVVEVKGTTSSKPAATVKSEQQSGEKGTTGTSGSAKVETKSNVKIDVRPLKVASARSVQNACPAPTGRD